MNETLPRSERLFRTAIRRAVPHPLRAAYWRIQRSIRLARVKAGRAHETHVCAAINRIIHPGWVCVDVGANRGMMTISMASRAGPHGRVYAFEPDPDNITHLNSNLRDCGLLDRVVVTQTAVDDGGCDSLQLYSGRRSSHSEWNIIGADADGRPTRPVRRVAVVSLDRYFDSIQRIDLVKIDVEGAESLVLAGMQRILRDWAPVMVIECQTGRNWTSCAQLCAHGYALEDPHGNRIDPFASPPLPHIIASRIRRAAAA